MDPSQQPIQPYAPQPLVPPQNSAGSFAGAQQSPVAQSQGFGAPLGQNPPMSPAQDYGQATAQTYSNQPSVPANPFNYPAQPTSSYAPINSSSASSMPVQAPINSIKQELVGHLQKANNVLVTVTSSPSVDQLAAAIGLTLVLNKLGKHATAVYSGQTPSTIEFLQPEKTIEKNTDSLRDFIIALDKSKADKLRYKVEDKFVKIFITPYHTSLTENDLVFSQGDFNVDVVVAIGVHQREELDQAITAHGRILHDAVTISINNKQTADLGALNWFQADASSLSEMIVSLIEPLQGDKVLLDNQIATAFLTGVVAETERFSNAKTTPHTMNISATLMKAGANQQLVASKLEIPKAETNPGPADDKKTEVNADQTTASKDGSLEIEHVPDVAPKPVDKTSEEIAEENKKNSDQDDSEDGELAKIHIDEHGQIVSADEEPETQKEAPKPPETSSNMIMTPPSIGAQMSSTSTDDEMEPIVEPMSKGTPLEHVKNIQPLTEEQKNSKTLEQIEQSVQSPHIENSGQSIEPEPISTAAQEARQAVDQAAAAVPGRLEPTSALNAQPIDMQSAPEPTTTEEIFPAKLVGPDRGLPPDPTAGASDPSAPPPVPPPLMPPVL